MFHRVLFFFFNDTATTEIYTLSLHDALPIFLPDHHQLRDDGAHPARGVPTGWKRQRAGARLPRAQLDRKSTRLNSSHANISYAVFCLKKKKKTLDVLTAAGATGVARGPRSEE